MELFEERERQSSARLASGTGKELSAHELVQFVSLLKAAAIQESSVVNAICMHNGEYRRRFGELASISVMAKMKGL